MNAKIQKVAAEIEKTKEKIKELQTLLPELEKQKTDLEIITLVRSAANSISTLFWMDILRQVWMSVCLTRLCDFYQRCNNISEWHGESYDLPCFLACEITIFAIRRRSSGWLFFSSCL